MNQQLIGEYCEPNYCNIVKRELFDEDIMKGLLQDQMFSKEDRMKLSNYNKIRTSGSRVNVAYKFGLGCEDFKLGRLFPEGGLGLQGFRFDMRNPLADKWYWDIDVENAHYVIARKFCEDNNIVCEKIKHYIDNREECLAMISPIRKKAKTEFLKILYGGEIRLYHPDFYNVEGDVHEEGIQFLKQLKNEVDTLMTVLWDKNKQYHKLKTGNDRRAIDKKPNPKASLMSLIFQTEERKILMVMDWYLTKINRYMAVYIHDGGLVEKLEGEQSFPQENFEAMEELVLAITGYKVNISQKPIKYDWKPYKAQETQYEIMKKEFEEKNFMVGVLINCIHSDGYIEQLKVSDARTKFYNKTIMIWDEQNQKNVKKKFFDVWLEDPKRRYYERMDFYPNRQACPETIYNLFKGFEGEKHICELTKEKVETNVAPIIKHLDYITSGYSSNILKWFANIIQTPHIKSEIAQVIRDMGGLFTEGGGTGKNLFIEWFGNSVLGKDYFIVVGDNKELYSSFNSIFEAKLLVFIEEASGKENHNNTDTLKSKITNKTTNVNKKCVAQYKVNDYSRYLFSSNNRNALPIRQGDRRFTVYDTNTEMRGNVKYFIDLAKHLENPEVIYSFYKYLNELPTYTSPIDFWNKRPITEAYRDIRRINAPTYHKWIISLLREGRLTNDYTTDLYKQYIKWIEVNREKSSDFSTPTSTAFGRLLTDASSDVDISYQLEGQGTKTKKGGGLMFMTWNIEAVVKGFKNLHLIEEEFKYKHCEDTECEIEETL
jgi:hypothetical protein